MYVLMEAVESYNLTVNILIHVLILLCLLDVGMVFVSKMKRVVLVRLIILVKKD
jgi:hypothetical protein